MAKWISKEKARWFMITHSTKERRLVTINMHGGSPLEVIPIGEFKVPWFTRPFNSLAYVNMGPKQIDVNLAGNASTSDGVTIGGKVSVQVIIKDEESCIKRIVIDPDEEERLLGASILTAVQEITASYTWRQMISVGEDFSITCGQKLSELLNRSTSCFEAKSLSIQEICPHNKAFAELLAKAAEVKEDEKLQRDLALLRAERMLRTRNGFSSMSANSRYIIKSSVYDVCLRLKMNTLHIQDELVILHNQ